jgi:hypothetical protein
MGPAAQGTGPAAARAQIAWGLNYIRGRYGSPGSAWAHELAQGWYGQGGRIPGGGAALNPVWGGWHQGGGDFVATRPTMIGVGESGRERIRIRSDLPGPRAGGSRGRGGHSVRIGDIHVHYHGAGDITAAVHKELEGIATAFDTLGDEDDSDLFD